MIQMFTPPEVDAVVEIEGYHFPIPAFTVTGETFTMEFQTVEDFNTFERLLCGRALYSTDRFTRYFDATATVRGKKTLFAYSYVQARCLEQKIVTCQAFEKVEQ